MNFVRPWLLCDSMGNDADAARKEGLEGSNCGLDEQDRQGAGAT